MSLPWGQDLEQHSTLTSSATQEYNKRFKGIAQTWIPRMENEVNDLAVKPDDLNLISGIYMVEEENP